MKMVIIRLLELIPMVQAQAFFNWVGLEEDRSMGAHNPKYVKALLKNSIDAIVIYNNN